MKVVIKFIRHADACLKVTQSFTRINHALILDFSFQLVKILNNEESKEHVPT